MHLHTTLQNENGKTFTETELSWVQNQAQLASLIRWDPVPLLPAEVPSSLGGPRGGERAVRSVMLVWVTQSR